MLQKRLQRLQQLHELEQLLASMPAYPIYHETNGQYSIYTQGRRCTFATLAAARIGQLRARANWLRTHPYDISMDRSFRYEANPRPEA